jgi:hypothetical protein
LAATATTEVWRFCCTFPGGAGDLIRKHMETGIAKSWARMAGVGLSVAFGWLCQIMHVE